MIYEFPPTDIAVPWSKNWTKSYANPVAGVGGRTYARYSFVANATSIAPGNYTAWADSVWSPSAGTDYNSGEYPPSAAFDKRPNTDGSNLPGWHVNAGENNAAIILKNLYLSMPRSILLNRYSIEIRNDGSVSFSPTAWAILGSNDGATWDALDVRSSIPNTVGGAVYDFNVSMPRNTYSIYRFATNGKGGIGEWRLFGSME